MLCFNVIHIIISVEFFFDICLCSMLSLKSPKLGNDHSKPHSLMSDPASTMFFQNMSCDLSSKVVF